MVYIYLKGFYQTLGYANGRKEGHHFIEYQLRKDAIDTEFFATFGWERFDIDDEYVESRGLDDKCYNLVFAVNIEDQTLPPEGLVRALGEIIKKSQEPEVKVIELLRTELQSYLCSTLQDCPDFFDCGWEYQEEN